MNNIAEPVLIQAFIPKAAVETLNKSVLCWLTRQDKPQFHAMPKGPLIECAAGKFRSLNRGLSDHDVETLEKLKAEGKPVLVCLNKVDMLRPNDKEKMVQVTKTHLQTSYVIETAFDPDPRLSQDGPIGAQVVFDWVVNQLEVLGKETEHLKEEQKQSR